MNQFIPKINEKIVFENVVIECRESTGGGCKDCYLHGNELRLSDDLCSSTECLSLSRPDLKNVHYVISNTVNILGVNYEELIASQNKKLACSECDLDKNRKACDSVECRKEFRKDSLQVIYKLIK